MKATAVWVGVLTGALVSTALAVPARSADTIHPAVTLRDDQDVPVGEDVARADAERSCDGCHDVDYILTYNTHRQHGVEIDCLDCHLGGDPESFEPQDFDAVGRLTRGPTPPGNEICGQCHGLVHEDRAFLEILPELEFGEIPGPYAQSLLTGEVFSPQTRSSSFLDLEHKQQLAYPWDVHAERGMQCTSCHFPANDPARADLATRAEPSHLIRDPRVLALSVYLHQPDHRLAVASCTACHDPGPAHHDLPYPKRHLATLSCQACHAQTLHGPALEWQDRTVVTAAGGPRMKLRGVDTDHGDYPNTWFYQGYSPVLLHERHDGFDQLAPYNPVTTWQWVANEPAAPVSDALVRLAFLNEDGGYWPEVVDRLDADGDHVLAPRELVLDSAAKVAVIRERLAALGVRSPRIAASIDFVPVRHGMVAGRWVVQECTSCHSAASRLNAPVELATGPWPGGVVPSLTQGASTLLGGRYVTETDGVLRLAGNEEPPGHYVLGHSRRPWSDLAGFWLFCLAASGVAVHSVARWVATRRRGLDPTERPRAPVYMYYAAERLWHWTMALSVIALLLSGLSIHYPQEHWLFGMRSAVFAHNLFATVLLITAFLSILVHVVTGEVRQFVPSGAGLAQRLRVQVRYYLKGIFVGASHPFAKRRAQKLNPLQQLTYAGLLNLLLPFQMVTGILLWVAGTDPGSMQGAGGLSVIAPLHNLGSWLFLTFVVVHVYLTTTGHTPTSNLKAMVTGWGIEEGPTGTQPETEGAES